MRRLMVLFLIITAGSTVYVAMTASTTTALVFAIALAISMASGVAYALLDDRHSALVVAVKIGLVAITLPLLVSCAGAPITATSPEGRASTTYSLDMEVRGCTVRTYRDRGVDTDGEPYLRMGRVFWNERQKALAYLPNFSWMSGALSFATLGMADAISGGERTAVLVFEKGEWRAMERMAPNQFRMLVADPILENARDKAAVVLQTRDTRIASCEDVIWR